MSLKELSEKFPELRNIITKHLETLKEQGHKDVTISSYHVPKTYEPNDVTAKL